jgi:hypothetical protein
MPDPHSGEPPAGRGELRDVKPDRIVEAHTASASAPTGCSTNTWSPPDDRADEARDCPAREAAERRRERGGQDPGGGFGGPWTPKPCSEAQLVAQTARTATPPVARSGLRGAGAPRRTPSPSQPSSSQASTQCSAPSAAAPTKTAVAECNRLSGRAMTRGRRRMGLRATATLADRMTRDGPTPTPRRLCGWQPFPRGRPIGSGAARRTGGPAL